MLVLCRAAAGIHPLASERDPELEMRKTPPEQSREVDRLRRRLIELASNSNRGEAQTLADLVRHLLTTPSPEDGLPAFMPYRDPEGREVWAERASLSPEQWERVLEFALQRLQSELD